MDDRLEKFIKANREELDVKMPRESLWVEIEQELPVKSKQRTLTKPVIYWRAAAVVLLLLSSWLVFDKVSQHSNTSPVVAELNPQLMEAEQYYIALIDQKRNEIQVMSEKYDFGGEFLSEIDRLDSMYTVLKQDMTNGNEENLVDAMILNLQLRIEILNQQLSIIQSIENSQQDEAVIL